MNSSSFLGFYIVIISSKEWAGNLEFDYSSFASCHGLFSWVFFDSISCFWSVHHLVISFSFLRIEGLVWFVVLVAVMP